MGYLATETPSHVTYVCVTCDSESTLVFIPFHPQSLQRQTDHSGPSPAENIHRLLVPSLGEEQIVGTVPATSLCSDLMLGGQDWSGEGRLLF